MHICDPNNSELNKQALPDLPYNQGGVGRHKCIFCAYLKGAQLALNNVALNEDVIVSALRALPERQAGGGRHKCARTALESGYKSQL